MGWTSSNWTRAEMISAITRATETLKHCCVGNSLWTIQRWGPEGKKTTAIVLYLMERGKDEWAYKDIPETMGPCEVSCPLSYLEECPLPEPPMFAANWRERVKTAHAHAKEAGAMEPGQSFWGTAAGKFYWFVRDNGRFSVIARDADGKLWKVRKKDISFTKVGDGSPAAAAAVS